LQIRAIKWKCYAVNVFIKSFRDLNVHYLTVQDGTVTIFET